MLCQDQCLHRTSCCGRLEGQVRHLWVLGLVPKDPGGKLEVKIELKDPRRPSFSDILGRRLWFWALSNFATVALF